MPLMRAGRQGAGAWADSPRREKEEREPCSPGVAVLAQSRQGPQG
jgi:hypothetical protein